MNRKNILLFTLGFLLIFGILYSFNYMMLATDAGFGSGSGGSSSGGSTGFGSSGSSYGEPMTIEFALLITLFFVVIFYLVFGTKSNSDSSKPKKVLTEEEKLLLENCYQIFKDVQIAWMNFDYDSLRKLVIDELYNMYYNQLQTLSHKGQKNIMHDFELVNYSIKEHTKDDYYEKLSMELEVEFFDYIVDANEKVVRGTKKT